jgi:hypothetical protein
MTQAARKLGEAGVSEETGLVVRLEEGAFVVRGPSGVLRAKRAASCLLAPAEGDLALVAVLPSGSAYVLAVLERGSDEPAKLTVEGDLTVAASGGRLTLAADEGVALASSGDVTIASGRVRVHAEEASLVARTVSVVGGLLRGELEKVKLLAGSLDAVLDRWSQRVKRSYRTVEETDQVRAAAIDYVAEDTMSFHGKNAVVTAEQLVKVDGSQIHLG